MSGHGGYKHRKRKLDRKRRQDRKKGHENVARVRAKFEAKGQTWDPASHAPQAEAMNHAGRRVAMPRA